MVTDGVQIRVSAPVKRILDWWRQTDESCNDVLERVLIGETSDSISGIDRESDTESDPVSLHHKRAKSRRNPRMQQPTTDDTTTDS